MAGIINTGSIPKALYPGVNAWFGMSYAKHPPEWQELFDQYTSDRNYEEDVQVVGMGLATIKAQGAPVSYDSIQQGYISRYTHLAWAKGFIVTKEEMADNLYAELGRQRSEALAFSMNQTKEIQCANVYNNAFSSSYTGGDGVSLLNASHPIQGTSFSNVLSTAAPISEASLEAFYINIGLAVDDRSLKIGLKPRSLILPINLYPTACRILKSTLQNDSANNAINWLNQEGMFPGGVHVNHYLSSATSYFIRTDCPNGMKHFKRVGMEFTQDNDFDTENAKFKAYERYAIGWTDPRGLYGTNPT